MLGWTAGALEVPGDGQPMTISKVIRMCHKGVLNAPLLISIACAHGEITRQCDETGETPAKAQPAVQEPMLNAGTYTQILFIQHNVVIKRPRDVHRQKSVRIKIEGRARGENRGDGLFHTRLVKPNIGGEIGEGKTGV